jgi:hypothetical protein
VIISVVGGVMITLLTGLLSNMPTPLLGAEHYGYPLPWLFRLILAPEYFPWRVDAVALVVDVFVWTIVMGIVLSVLTKMKRSWIAHDEGIGGGELN